jgi:NTE family protein
MNIHIQPHAKVEERRLPFEVVALVLQGGGALGACLEALAEAGIHPDRIAGVSIGAINAAIIAGNPPDSRVHHLREFWTQVTSDGPWPFFQPARFGLARGNKARNLFNQFSASLAFANGAKGFFAARSVNPWLQPVGTIEATSFYDTSELKRTLERLVDFDRLNAGPTRLSVGAVNVRSGNFLYFDTTTHTIQPEHVMASGALPPGFPAIEIEASTTGTAVSYRTPLQWVVDCEPRRDTLAFQVDLWNAHGEFPREMLQVITRERNPVFQPHSRRHRSV